MKKTILILALFTLLTAPLFADDNKTITLQDGSRIKGRVVSIDNGSYVIETSSMGEIRVADSNIASIAAAGIQPEEQKQPKNNQEQGFQLPANITATPEFQSIQAQMMSNPTFINDIQQLIQDPEVMAVMSDPGFVAAVQSGNTASLQSDPRLMKLAENPKIKALIQKFQGQ